MDDKPKKIEDQVTLTQMLKALDKGVSSGLEKQLKKLSKKKAFRVPLDKNKADQVERKGAYNEVVDKVTRWEPLLDQRKRSKHLSFPLDHQPTVLPSAAEAIGDLIPNNDLERDVQEILRSSESALHDKAELSKAEEKYLKAISAEEAQERHRELQKMRVLLSSHAVKMKHQKQIKSKSYRRLLKQERIKRHVKKVESDKDLLLDEIERLQKLRAKERASLKHKNTGKWAKHAKFRAKYDEEARNAMLEQIGLSKKFTEKPVSSDSESSESDDDDSLSEASEESVTENDEKMNKICDTKDVDTVDQLIVSSELIKSRMPKKRRSLDDSGTEEDEDDEDDQRRLISEAFADDDVVAEFQKSKEQLRDEEQPKDVDNFLPGWGDWAGPGIKVNKRKRKKFIVKAEKVPRKDDKLGNVIISEQADSKMNDLMIKKLPRGMRNAKQLAKILTRPTAANFVSQSVHRESIRPRVELKMGARIEPLSEKALSRRKAKWAK